MLINSAKDVNWAIALEISANGRKYDVSKWIQSFAIPDITLSPVEIGFGSGRIKVAGDSPTYSPLSIQFIIDENWEIISLLYSNLFAGSRASDPQSIFGSCTLFAMDAYRIPKFKIEFLNLVPSSVSSINLQTTMNSTPLVAQVQFDFTQLLFRKMGTSGEYGLGAGNGTTGLYRADGTNTSSTYQNDERYRKYQVMLIEANAKHKPWTIELLGDDDYTVLYSSDNTPSFANANQNDPFENSSKSVLSGN
jgi:hypothetical protein